MKRLLGSFSLLGAGLAVLILMTAGPAAAATPLQMLGELLYFDENLSTPRGQACASCHEPSVGFDDPDSDLPVSQGVLPKNRFGNRNSPASGYAMYAPMFYFDAVEGLWIGGQFWDGRATGDVLGDPLADQALGPFLNPLEMNNPSKLIVIEKVKKSDYADLFEMVWGDGALDSVETAYDQVALSIAAFERTGLFGQFTSKYDYYLMACLMAGNDTGTCSQGLGNKEDLDPLDLFTDQEWSGLVLFMGENDNDGILEEGEGAFCSACHVADWTVDTGIVAVPNWAPQGMVPPVFTDFSFDNLGVPANPENPFYTLPPAFNPDGADFVDLGLGAALANAGQPAAVYEGELGKVKVMSLRNIAITDPYMHNGFFSNLKDVVHFYNTRDVEPWDAPEVAVNVNTDELGSLGLSEEDEWAVVRFMECLTDGYTP